MARRQNYVQYYEWTTGYVPNSSPPEFKPELKRLVHALGSFQKRLYDNRLSFGSLKQKVLSEKHHETCYIEIVGKDGKTQRFTAKKSDGKPADPHYVPYSYTHGFVDNHSNTEVKHG